MSAVAVSAIVDELSRVLQAVQPQQTSQLTRLILEANAVFVAGAGRSGLMMKAFAMRLMHAGIPAYVVGETITPGIGSNDLLLIGSGSGETKNLAAMAAKAQSTGASVAAITIKRDSTISRSASVTVEIPAVAKHAETASSVSIQPMGSLFEQSLLLVLDSVVLAIMESKNLYAGMMYSRHANLE
ncbi:6-phospho-3-hexuloisomerase [Paenibacillus protaetiae]|uniref:6-phospho-3-hexuloisomerase n=1 Tax=Paenibacillus protaetiae TaxID=2509456 RepID=A0A4P6F1C4_9BACL|nr:6-phospho-3-hexuloisomerase [Paenibacillus protaetiae]QAY66837.1 6-phospho-3-hexuloisomerase [Paenibacillus protaetiae]